MTQVANLSTSTIIIQRLRDEAQNFGFPDRRTATLDRLALACDAIEDGSARGVVEKYTGKPFRNLKITASNVEKYVRARGATDKEWTGPTRTTVSSDQGLKSYVLAREDERIRASKKVSSPKKFSTNIENVLGEIASIEVRQIIRRKLEEGRATEAKYKLLIAGLKKIPGIDLDLVLNKPWQDHKAETLSPSGQNNIDVETRQLVWDLYNRLTDEEAVRHFGMKHANGSLISMGSGTLVVKKAEIEALDTLIKSFLGGS